MDPPWTIVLYACVVALLCRRVIIQRALRRTIVCHVTHSQGNEQIIVAPVDTDVCATVRADLKGSLFLVDTGHGGAVVLSLAHLATLRTEGYHPEEVGLARDASHAVTDGALSVVAQRLRQRQRCQVIDDSFRQELVGIESVSSATSTLMQCPATPCRDVFGGATEWFVAKPLRGQVHILTCDFFRRRAPCLLEMARDERPPRIHLHIPDAEAWIVRRSLTVRFRNAFRDGNYFVPMRVNDRWLRILVDTGASAPLTLGRSAGDHIGSDVAPSSVLQRSWQGRAVCSQVHTCAVALTPAHSSMRVEVLVRTSDIADGRFDGHAGMGFLRMFDVWFDGDTLGLRRNGNAPKPVTNRRAGTCP
jgi:hypothetical protein